MARRQRFVDNENGIVEIGSRSLHGRYLLVPASTWVNALILGVVGRAQRLYRVEIYAMVFMSNHFHILMRVDSVEKMAGFVGFLKTNLAKELGGEFQWRECFWGRRYHSASLEEDRGASEVERFRYILANGCKEGLVASPLDWPGVSSAWALSRGIMTLDGIWLDRSARSPDGRGPARVQETVRLSPLPSLAHLSPAEYRDFVLQAIRKVEEDTKLQHRREGTRPLGAHRVQRRDPHDFPKNFRPSPARLFLTTTREGFETMRAAREEKAAAYREASEKLRRGETDVTFPDDCFPPRLPFVRKKRGPP